VSSDDVAAAAAGLPDKSSALDPIPVPVLKSLIYSFLLTYMFNLSLTSGSVPAGFKDSFITPVIKKPGLDDGSPSSYRPIEFICYLEAAWTSYRATTGDVPRQALS